MTFELLHDGGEGGAFFDQKNKNQFVTYPIHDITLEWFWVASPSAKTYRNCITFSTHTHAANTWTTTLHSFSVMICNVHTRYQQRCLILLMFGGVQFEKENSVRPTYVLKCTPPTSHCGKPNELGFHYTMYLHIRVSSLTSRIYHQQNECNA